MPLGKCKIELQQVAQSWQYQASMEQSAAQYDQAQAQAWQEEERRDELHEEQEIVWSERNHATAVLLWNQAAQHGRDAERYALGATVLAVLASFYFVPRVVLQTWKLLWVVRTTSRDDGSGWSDHGQWWGWFHTFCYSVMHCIILVLVAGLVDRDYWLYLTDYYNLWQRAVIVTWFAYLTAGLQTVLLHNVPHIWAVWTTTRLQTSVLRDVAVQFLLRLTVTFAFCVLEFLILWLTPLRTILWAPDSLRLWSCRYVRFTAMVLLVMYVVIFESPSLHDPVTFSATTDHSTVLLSEDDDEDDDLSEPDSEVGSELSPLQACVNNNNNNKKKANHSSSGIIHSSAMTEILSGSGSHTSSSPTNDLPHVYFRNMQRAVERSVRRQQQQQQSRTLSSRYAVNLQHEGWKLTLTAEILLSVCSWCAVRYGVAVSYAGHPWSTVVVGIVVLLATILSWLWWCRSESDRMPHRLSSDRVEPEKVAVYGSLTV